MVNRFLGYAALSVTIILACPKIVASSQGDYHSPGAHSDVVSVRDMHRAMESGDELTVTALLFLGIYQRYISSQDIQACVFDPSCSRYAKQAIDRYGFFRGVLMASDRLLRCHSYAHLHYEYDERTGKLFDPLIDPIIPKRDP